MFRFYLQWNGQDYTVMNETMGLIGKVWRRTQCNNITTPFIEMVVRRCPTGLDFTFIPMDVDPTWANWGPGLKSANDHNENEKRKESEEKDEEKDDANEFKYKLQKLIDMKVEYNTTEFMEDFDTMLEQMTEKYPVEKIQLKKTTKIIG